LVPSSVSTYVTGHTLMSIFNLSNAFVSVKCANKILISMDAEASSYDVVRQYFYMLDMLLSFNQYELEDFTEAENSAELLS
jgi:hypothetical protein